MKAKTSEPREEINHETCPHPPSRNYSGIANNENIEPELWVGCCDCGLVRYFVLPPKRK